jgi:hypothetical protein
VDNDSSGSSDSSGASGEEEDDTVAVMPPAGLEDMSVEEIEDYRRSEMAASVTTATQDQHGNGGSNEQGGSTGVVRRLLSRLYRRATPRRRELQQFRVSTGSSRSSSRYSSIGSNDLNKSLRASEATSPAFPRVAAAGISVTISELNRGRDSSSSCSDRSETPLVLSPRPAHTLKES